ncbi:hypothetical protein ACROYT_G036259 [Oculina patagonica]
MSIAASFQSQSKEKNEQHTQNCEGDPLDSNAEAGFDLENSATNLDIIDYYTLCDEPESSFSNRDQEMSEIDVDITPESVDDDSYSSSLHESDSDSDDKDEFGINKHYLANEIKNGFKRVHIEYVDPVAQKLVIP